MCLFDFTWFYQMDILKKITRLAAIRWQSLRKPPSPSDGYDNTHIYDLAYFDNLDFLKIGQILTIGHILKIGNILKIWHNLKIGSFGKLGILENLVFL